MTIGSVTASLGVPGVLAGRTTLPLCGAVGVIMEVCVVSETSPSCSALGLLCGSGAQVCPLAVSGHTSRARRSSTSWQG